ERAGAQLPDEADELPRQRAARVVRPHVPGDGVALARRAADDRVAPGQRRGSGPRPPTAHPPTPEGGPGRGAGTPPGADRSGDHEAGSLKAEVQAAGATEQGDRSWFH